MNHFYDLSSFETVESLIQQIEEDYLISENDKTKILVHLEEYFWLKENNVPSLTSSKWTQISKMLDAFYLKVKQ